MFRKNSKGFFRYIGIVASIALLTMQLLAPILQNRALAKPLNDTADTYTVFEKLSMDDRLRVRNLAIVYEKCRNYGDDAVSADEMTSGKWFNISNWRGSPENVVVGKFVEPTDGVVDCAGDDAGWLWNFLQLAGYPSLEEAFGALSVPKPAGSTDPDGTLKPIDEMKQVLNAQFGTDVFSLSNQDYLTYYSNKWIFENTCKAKQVSAVPNVGLSANVYVETGGEVKQLLYTYQNESYTDDIGLPQGTGVDKKCSSIVTYLSDKAHADAYLVALTALAEVQGTTPEDASAGASSSSSVTTLTDTCYDKLPGFGWIICGVVDAADGMYGVVKSWVYLLLAIPEASYSSNTALYNTWSTTKNLASTGLALIALVMVASQIFSFEFMSAYTVKKVLPRLVIAAVIIQISWFLFTMLIQLSNAVGFGLYELLTNAFGTDDIINMLGQTSGGGASVTGNIAGMALIGGSVAGILAALAPGAWITLSLTLIGVIVSLAVAIFTLIVRKMLIIILLVISPIALLFWILPGTQNLWSTWWKLYSRLLMMFPLIALLFAAGTISANIIMNSGEPDALKIISAIVVFFAPMFLITATFKFAGSVFGAVTGGLNKLGGKVSGSGFGLRARQDAYKKLKNEQRAMAINESSRRNMAKALDPNANTFRKLQGRSALGPAGYIPKIAGKRLNRAQQQYGALTDKLDMDDAKLAWSGATKSFGHGKLMDAETEVIDTPIGEKATFKDDAGRDRSILVTPHVKRLALASAAASKNDAPLLRAAVTAGQKEELSAGVPNPAYKPAEAAAFNAFLGQDGGFGGVDSIAADASRGTPNDIVSAAAMPAGLKNFGTQRTSSHKDAAGNVVIDLDRQQAMIDQVHALSLGAAFEGTYGHDKDTSKQKATAAAAINAFAARDDLKDIAPADIAKWSSVPIAIYGGGGTKTNAAEVIGGNYRATIDPSTGELVAVKA